MRNLFCIILLGFICLSANSKVADSSKVFVLVKLTPVQILDPMMPNIMPGFEFIKRNHSMEIGYGIRFTKLGLLAWNEGKTNFHYLKFRLEYRYLITTPYKRFNPYGALEFFFNQGNYNRDNGSYSSGMVQFAYETAKVERRVLGFCAKAGLKINLKNKLVLESFGGLGYRNATIDYEVQHAQIVPTVIFKDLIFPDDQFEGSFNRPHLAIGAKLGYSLN